MNLPDLRRGSFFAAVLLATVSGRLVAQDVTVTSLQWIETKDAPDELPTLKKRPEIEFPRELRGTSEIGYVVRELTVDEKARNHGGAEATTQPAYLRAVLQGSGDWKFNPGRRAGKAVNTATRMAFIFNPASAAEKIPDATPRLLEVAAVELPWPKGVKPSQTIADQIVFAEVRVGIDGTVVAITGAPPELARDFEIAAKNWRFAPARKGGQSVVEEVRLPFVVVTRSSDAEARSKFTQPRVTFQARPDYPWTMRANGMRGEVLVDFVVDHEGRVRNAHAVRSLNPSFDDSAVDAVEKWRFEPGRAGEKPVSTQMQVPIVFELSGGGQGPLEAKGKADLSKLPEAYRYDTPPKPLGTVRPVYPYELLKAAKTGKADIGFIIGTSGRVVQIVPGAASAPAFSRALAAAIEHFVFEPAIKAGRPAPAVLRFSQDFDRGDSWRLVDDDDLALLRREEKKPESIVTKLGELDGPLVPRSRRPPVFPCSAPEGVTSGSARIEFLVDEEGRARLPRIVSSTHEAFGYAAVQSIASWRFEPPKRGGRSVVVRVEIPVAFGEDKAEESK